ncbi:MAG TPA: DUF1800 domain-containing protein [Candidatus Aquilonibacter sp.]|nr:DUF1800 domain-containing protein [Candidatus Aquilonibacter sp.]
MRLGRTRFAASVLVFCLSCIVPQLLAKKKQTTAPDSSDQKRALHALNRLTFGPRPGDVQQVAAMGVDRWIELQLHPEKIADSALNSRLEPFRTLRMSTREIAEDFPDPQEINQVMNGKRTMPSDPATRAIYEVQLAKLTARKERKEEEAKIATGSTAVIKAGEEPQASMTPAKPGPEEQEPKRIREEQPYANFDFEGLTILPADHRYQKILAMPQEELISFAHSLRGSKGRDFIEGMSPRQKETLLALNNPAAVVDSELAQAKLLRAIYSQRQLEEVMTDFWFNHFNVFAGKGLDRLMLTSYERDVIRPHALGRFEDLLVATAKSPAILFYLDNWVSVGPNSAQALGIPAHGYGPYAHRFPARNKRPSGLNENYGRELLELHTLSVNGGYSQRDVTEAAKVFTGWTIDKPAQGGEFKFEPRMHEPGPKFVLGHRIKEKGEDEGLELLHRLATSGQTAHFISLKLAERFVSDDPPPALVDRMAKTFLKKKGDIREVLSVLFHSPQFWDDSTYRAKVKTPLEFVASSVRATGAEVDDAMPLIRQLRNMGMPLYGAQPPTGYSMKADAWVSSSALLNRMNFALALTAGKVRGVRLNANALEADTQSSDPSAIVAMLEDKLVAGGVSQQTHDSIVAQIRPTTMTTAIMKTGNSGTIAGLLLGSPEFQRR